MRTPLIAANWKMHKTVGEAAAFVNAFLPAAAGLRGVEVAICPPFTALATVGRLLVGSAVTLGAQNLFPAPQGAFTGEVSPVMLRDLGVRYVILGHSERRQHFGEDDAAVAAKVKAAFDHGLVPILCVGESLAQREAGETETVVGRQVQAAVADLSAAQGEQLVIAYEPVWAIGSGLTPVPGAANAVCRYIRGLLAARWGAAAERVRIQYGGSVKVANIAAFAREPDIDGALVGGASLDVAGFADLVRAVAASAP